MFYKHSRTSKVVVLIVYIDDIILTSSDIKVIEAIKGRQDKEFEIKVCS